MVIIKKVRRLVSKKVNLNHFKSKLFIKLFMSYLIIITLFLVAFSGLVIYNATSVFFNKKNQEYHLKIEALANSMDLQVLSAKNIIASVNSSETIRMMYASTVVENKVMDSYLLYQGLGELTSMKKLSNNLDIFNIIVLFKGYNRAYTGSGVILLKDNYEGELNDTPYYNVATAGEVLDMPDIYDLTFSKENIVYGDNYSYSSTKGIVNGTILAMFNKKSLENKLSTIVGKYNGMTINYKENTVVSYGISKGVIFSCISGVDRNPVFHIYINKEDFKMELDDSVYFGVGFIVLTSILFVLTAYVMSNRYYSPIDNIVSIIMPPQSEGDEFDHIINGIQTLIGERNGYREKMVTISPYARQGMLHGILNGNMEQDRLKILSDNNFIDLKKPYFELVLANIDYQGAGQIREIHYMDMIDIIQSVCIGLSTEEIQILCYIKDNKNLFLITNSEEEQQLENTVYKLHQVILKEIDDENFMITFGVSKVQDNINYLKAACQETMDALDNMLTGGRNAVYFYESSYAADKKDYYFPKDATRRVAKDFRDRNMTDLKKFLDEIYKNNMDKYDATPRTIRLLVDELHIATLNALKINNVFNTTQIQIDKIENNVTLDEIFNYYHAIYETICSQLEDLVTPNQDIEKLNQDIINYMKDNFTNAELSLAHIGALFGVSNKYISLMCKNCLGVTYLQYVQEKRIEYASHLLQTTESSLEQIAGMCGYSNMLTFRRNFKSIMGMNPSDYRK